MKNPTEITKEQLHPKSTYIQSLKDNFALLVKQYRKERLKLTQKQLETLSSVPSHTIHDIEKSYKAVLDYETVEKLALAFELKGRDREAFFKTAGINVPSLDNVKYEWSRALFDFYKTQKFPAFVCTPQADLHSINSYALTLFNLDPVENFSIITASPGPNSLRFVFDPVFSPKKLYGNTWKSYAELNVWMFRQLTSPHTDEERYHQLLNEMQKFPDFMEIWESMNNFQPPAPPYKVTIYNERFGKANFTVAESLLPSANTERMLLVFYLPEDTQTAEVFSRIQNEIPRMAFQLDKHNGQYLSRIF